MAQTAGARRPTPGASGAPQAPPTAPGGRVSLAAVVATSAGVAALVVLRHLGTKPLWRDEAISVSVAARPVLRIVSVLPHHDANAGFYYLLLHTWLWFGHGTAWARGFSAMSFTATAALAAWAGHRWRGWETGLALGLLVALNPFLVYYGQETRPYALAVALAAVSTIALFWRGDGAGTQPAPRLYAAATVALIYADLLAVLYVATLAGAVLAVYHLRHQRVPAPLKRCWWIIGAATAPLAVVMLVFERGQISWLIRPTPQVLGTTITSMSSGWLGLEVVGVLAAVALIASRGARGARDRLIVVALVAGFALPPLGLWAMAQLTPVFIDRYVICSILALAGLAAAGLAALRDHLGGKGLGRVVALAVLAGLLVLGGQRVARTEAAPFKVDNTPAVVGFIQSQAQPGDAVAYAGGGLRTVIDASLPAGRSFPGDVALAPGGQASLQSDLYAREVTAPQLQSRLATVSRLWMVTDPSDQDYPQGGPFLTLKPLVLAAYAPTTTTSFGTIDVTLFVRRP